MYTFVYRSRQFFYGATSSETEVGILRDYTVGLISISQWIELEERKIFRVRVYYGRKSKNLLSGNRRVGNFSYILTHRYESYGDERN